MAQRYRTEAERKEFANRFHAILRDKGVRPHCTDIARTLSLLENRTVTPPTITKWLSGATFPGEEHLFTLAQWLEVDVNWLRTGNGPLKTPDGQLELSLSNRELRIMSLMRQMSQEGQLALLSICESLINLKGVKS